MISPQVLGVQSWEVLLLRSQRVFYFPALPVRRGSTTHPFLSLNQGRCRRMIHSMTWGPELTLEDAFSAETK